MKKEEQELRKNVIKGRGSEDIVDMVLEAAAAIEEELEEIYRDILVQGAK